ncbi:ribonuclease H-like domain-containing protein [Tanacetum coccineum]
MISIRMKKFYKKIGKKLKFDAKEPVGFDKTKVECYNCHKIRHFARECRSKKNQDSRRRDAWNTGNKDKDNGRRSGKHEDSKALVTLDGEAVQTQTQREQLRDASIKKQAYTKALMKVEAQLVAHQQSQLWYEEKISEETHESMPEPVINEPNVVSQPKVWSDAPIIEEYESDTVLTRTGKIQVNTARTSGTNTVNTARHNFNKHAVPTNAARKVNVVKPIVNNARPNAGFHKTLSSFRKPFNRTTALRIIFSKQKVNTAEVNAVSAVRGRRETAVRPSAGLSTKSSTKQRDC